MTTRITAQPGTPFIDIEREFNAAPAQVHRAWTDADLVARWLGPRDYTMNMFDYDARSGGSYRYVHVDKEGQEFGFRGVFHTVAPDRIVQTFEFEGWPGQVSVETATFEDLG
ncbi:SRPBCC domain-containing protein, partial [Kibdelosporangium lantanae]